MSNEMKTAEEWVKDWPFDADATTRIKAIQLDAFNAGVIAGMVEAADELQSRIEILEKLGAPGMYETAIHELKQRREAILAAADAK